MNTPTPPLPEELLELVATRLRALADPLRMRLLVSLEKREACVQELADELDALHQTVSRHLNVLHRDGLVARRREGTQSFYSLADYTALRLIAQAAASIAARIEELGEMVTEDRQ
jgi:DNA-binding transcriptional ArsR family regulator